MAEMFERGMNTPASVSTAEWQQISESPATMTHWLETTNPVVTETRAEDGRTGKFVRIKIDEELRWVDATDGTVVEDEALSFWNLD